MSQLLSKSYLRGKHFIRHRNLMYQRGQSVSLSTRSYQYFEDFELREDGIAIVRLNGPEKMNTISKRMQEESEKIFNEKVLNDKRVKALIFISSKSDNFIAGADIDMIKAVEDKSQLKDICIKGTSFFEEVRKKANIPFVAAINGAALGGGLEWALYCDYRIATTNKKTVLGLPEVKLGLLPGMAGTYHLPKLVGYAAALNMMLTGKNIKSDKAKKMGLVDLVVDPAALEAVAIQQAKGLIAGTVKPSKRKRDWVSYFMEETPLRSIMFSQAKKMVDKNSGGHYPAPYAIINLLENSHKFKSKELYLREEAASFSRLAATPVSEALIGLFFWNVCSEETRLRQPCATGQEDRCVRGGTDGCWYRPSFCGQWEVCGATQR